MAIIVQCSENLQNYRAEIDHDKLTKIGIINACTTYTLDEFSVNRGFSNVGICAEGVILSITKYMIRTTLRDIIRVAYII